MRRGHADSRYQAGRREERGAFRQEQKAELRSERWREDIVPPEPDEGSHCAGLDDEVQVLARLDECGTITAIDWDDLLALHELCNY